MTRIYINPFKLLCYYKTLFGEVYNNKTLGELQVKHAFTFHFSLFLLLKKGWVAALPFQVTYVHGQISTYILDL